MIDYKILVKNPTNFQKVLNQWKHEYDLVILWMDYDKKDDLYKALILRRKIKGIGES